MVGRNVSKISVRMSRLLSASSLGVGLGGVGKGAGESDSESPSAGGVASTRVSSGGDEDGGASITAKPSWLGEFSDEEAIAGQPVTATASIQL